LRHDSLVGWRRELGCAGRTLESGALLGRHGLWRGRVLRLGIRLGRVERGVNALWTGELEAR
jgi:hypothetical protein